MQVDLLRAMDRDGEPKSKRVIATEVHRSQSAVEKVARTLRELVPPLIESDTRGYRLTPAGQGMRDRLDESAG